MAEKDLFSAQTFEFVASEVRRLCHCVPDEEDRDLLKQVVLWLDNCCSILDIASRPRLDRGQLETTDRGRFRYTYEVLFAALMTSRNMSRKGRAETSAMVN